ncbi:MAG: hypothetical protein P4L11_13605 [Geothrix sp.]|nr:hypothetical protein [Geothrix sp.]
MTAFLSIKDQKREARQKAASAKVPLATRVAFMDAWLASKDFSMKDLAKAQGISEDAAWGILSHPPSYKQRRRLEADALPLATRQAFLDAMKAGRTMGEACTATGISTDAGISLLARAFKRRTHYDLDWVAK